MNDYNKGLLPEPCMRLPYGWVAEWKSIELGDGTGYVRLDVKTGTCTVESIHGFTDAHVNTRYFVELSCHTIDDWSDSEPPKFCPYCGRKVIDQDARDLRDAIAADDGKRYSMSEVMEIVEDGE